ncbi:hypothetical protein EW146_g1073 [Bondarzewia mesenterica]|uniref:Uncharacterized protein n=1 Tax=Bondarzewia mesenterica TaxID=1095465 RepID=A0A4V3XG68_9AGAM|nr:hypothetical protein EW146_g1073 [Bondarzewia mesenterica]
MSTLFSSLVLHRSPSEQEVVEMLFRQEDMSQTDESQSQTDSSQMSQTDSLMAHTDSQITRTESLTSFADSTRSIRTDDFDWLPSQESANYTVDQYSQETTYADALDHQSLASDSQQPLNDGEEMVQTQQAEFPPPIRAMSQPDVLYRKRVDDDEKTECGDHPDASQSSMSSLFGQSEVSASSPPLTVADYAQKMATLMGRIPCIAEEQNFKYICAIVWDLDPEVVGQMWHDRNIDLY